MYGNVKIKMHEAIILAVVMYGSGSFSVTVGKEPSLIVFENVCEENFGLER
jgi:hypothetical protein